MLSTYYFFDWLINLFVFGKTTSMSSCIKKMITTVTWLKYFLGLWVWLLLLLLEMRLVLAKDRVEYSQSALQVLMNNVCIAQQNQCMYVIKFDMCIQYNDIVIIIMVA